MEVWKVKLFIHMCVVCVAAECLQLKEDELICLIEECLAVALLLGDVATQRISYMLLGTIHEKIYQIGKAIEYYKQHLHIAYQMGNINGQFAAFENLGNAYCLLGNFHEATKYHEKCLKLAKVMCDKKGEGGAYANLGHDYQSLGNYDKAIEYHERCLNIAKEIKDRKLEAIAYDRLGYAYQSLGKHQNAIKHHDKSLSIATEIDDKEGKAAACGNLGNAYQSLGKYQDALDYYEKALKIAMEIGDRRGEGTAYANIGTTYNFLGKYREATQYQENHLIIAKEIGDRQGEQIAYANLGTAYRSLGKYPEAIKYHEKSLSIAIEMGDRTNEGSSYENLGTTYRYLGKYQKAITYHEKSLDIAVEIGNRNVESCAFGNLGNTYHSLGKYYRAKECQEKRLAIAMDIGDRKGQEDAYRCLGNVYCSLGKYQKGIEYHGKSLAIALEINDKKGEGVSYANLGGDYHRLGKFHEAKQYFEKQLSIAKEIGDRAGEVTGYKNIGEIHKLLGKYEKAIEYHKKSVDIAVEIGDRNGEGTGYGYLGNAYHSLGKYHRAIEYQEKCLGIAKEIGDRKGEGVANGSIGNIFQSLKKYQEATDYHRKHLSIAEEIDDRDGQGLAHFHIGECYGSLAMQQDSDQPTNMKETECHLKKSIQSFESVFDDLEQDQYKISIVDTFIEAYRELTQFYVQTQQTKEALLVSDRGRARALGDLLTSKYCMKKDTTLKSESTEVPDTKMIFSTCNFSILFYALQRGDITVHIFTWVLAHQSPLCFHHSKMKRIESSVKHPSSEKDPEEIDEQYIFNLVKKGYGKMKVREGLKCKDRSLELPEVADQDIDQDTVSSHAAKEREIGKFNKADAARCIYDEDHDDDEKPMDMLYDALVAPVQHRLVQDEIVIIPDGPLFMVPYAAFQNPKTGQFLSETKRIRLAPSLTALKVLQESSNDHHDKSGALIVGNPEIGKVKFESMERSFTDLPGAEDEAIDIAKLLGVEPLIGRQATKEAVVQKLQVGVSVIHFAAHGSQENGQIFLAPSASSATNSIPDEQDYILTMNEAQESGIRAQLVVLSCCHSGRGEIKSEGVVGMSRAFLAAGARAVVASLWAIDDNATKVFMLKFYSHLKKGESASRSLQQAMKDMRETERYSEPRYWAAFFLIGDDVTISV